MAVKVLKGEAQPAKMPIEKPNKYDFAINGTVAEEIGIKIPDDLLEYVIYK